METPQTHQLQVNIAKDAIKALYSDIVFLQLNPLGITLDFGQHLSAARRIEIVSRISLSPQHAKLFANTLTEHVKTYEKQFGEIKVTDKMKKEIQDKRVGFQA